MAFVFDLYGTLLDLDSLMAPLERRFGPRAGAFAELWRRKQVEYSWLLAAMGAYLPFDEVTRRAAAYALEALDLEGSADALAALYDKLHAHPDAAQFLRRLPAGQRAVLSNGPAAAIDSALERSGLRPWVDVILSADGVASFKPDPKVYRQVIERFGCPPSDVWFFSSNAWDAAGASAFGFRVAWVRRRAVPPERIGGDIAVVIERLTDWSAAG